MGIFLTWTRGSSGVFRDDKRFSLALLREGAIC